MYMYIHMCHYQALASRWEFALALAKTSFSTAESGWENNHQVSSAENTHIHCHMHLGLEEMIIDICKRMLSITKQQDVVWYAALSISLCRCTFLHDPVASRVPTSMNRECCTITYIIIWILTCNMCVPNSLKTLRQKAWVRISGKLVLITSSINLSIKTHLISSTTYWTFMIILDFYE